MMDDSNIRFIDGLAPLMPAYRGVVLDLWGVVHDGVTPFPGAIDCMRRLRDANIPYIMLSNAPRRADAIIESMVAMGIPADLCGKVMSSGEATYKQIANPTDPWYADLGRKCLHIGPARDLGLFEGLEIERVETAEDADFIVNTGPWDDNASVADYETTLAAGVRRGLKMICANPDLEVIRGGVRIICAGALAARYAELGGDVRYNGKPDPAIYRLSFDVLGLGQADGLLAVGDSLRTDIAGAAAAGIDSVLVMSGIHGEAFAAARGGGADPAKVRESCAQAGLRPVAVMPALAW